MDIFNIVFGIVTIILSYMAYRFSKERFRLELFDKRFAIYENVLEFCSMVIEVGSFKINDKNKDKILAVLKAAESSFRGKGLHKACTLFGEDIKKLFEQLNISYAWLSAHSNFPDDFSQRKEWRDNYNKHFTFVWKTIEKLPEAFKPYIYFGDSRKQPWYKFWK